MGRVGGGGCAVTATSAITCPALRGPRASIAVSVTKPRLLKPFLPLHPMRQGMCSGSVLSRVRPQQGVVPTLNGQSRKHATMGCAAFAPSGNHARRCVILQGWCHYICHRQAGLGTRLSPERPWFGPQWRQGAELGTSRGSECHLSHSSLRARRRRWPPYPQAANR